MAEDRVATTLAAAAARDREIVAGLPVTVCRSPEDVDAVSDYLKNAIKALPGVERDALLYSSYFDNLLRTGALVVPEAVVEAAFTQRVRAAAKDGPDDD